MKSAVLVVLALLFLGCSSLPTRIGLQPPAPPNVEPPITDLPQASTPLRVGGEVPHPHDTEPQISLLPSIPEIGKSSGGIAVLDPSAKIAPPSPSDLPKTALPRAQDLPAPVIIKPIVQNKPATTATKPAVPTPKPSPSASTSTTTWTSPTTTPEKPSSTGTALSGTLLPQAPKTGADIRWEDVNAKPGDDVFLQFTKLNWVYLDSPDNQKRNGFIETRREKEGTSFLFRPKFAGTYELEFQRQDLGSGTTETRKVRLNVVNPDTRMASNAAGVPQTTTRLPGSFQDTSRDFQNTGRLPEAVQKLLQNYQSDDTRLNLQLGTLLKQSNQGQEALKYLDRNLNRITPDLQDSLGLATQIASTDPFLSSRLPIYLRLWTDYHFTPPESLYLQAVDSLKKAPETKEALDWLSHYDEWFPLPTQRDRYLFLKAGYLESPGIQRNLREAWKLYNQIVSTYPLSPFWEAAGQRAAYLNSHFLQVR